MAAPTNVPPSPDGYEPPDWRLDARRARLEDLARKAQARLLDARVILAGRGGKALSPRMQTLYERREFIFDAMVDGLAEELEALEEAA